jgi:hypothetical protein
LATEASLAALAEAPAVIAVDVGGRSIKRALVPRPRPPIETRNGDEPCLERHQN